MLDYETDYLSHKGKRGMKWGYNDGKRNGKRTAGDAIKDALGYDERERYEKAAAGAKRNADAESNLQDRYNKDAHDMAYHDPYTGAVSYSPDEKKYLNNKYSKLERQRKKSDAADKAMLRAFEKYKKTPLGKLDMTITKINRGKEFVARSLEKLAGKVRSSKRHVSKP